MMQRRWSVSVGVVCLWSMSAAAYAQVQSPWRGNLEMAAGSDVDGRLGGARVVSSDGRFVVFTSASQVYVDDRLLQTIERVSVSTSGDAANDQCADAAISADGRYVAFTSKATNLVPGSDGRGDLFVRDRQAGTTIRIDFPDDGSPGAVRPTAPSISTTGRYLTFAAGTPARAYLVDRDGNANDIFDEPNETTLEVASVSSAGDLSDGTIGRSLVSTDGRYVAFESTATVLVPGASGPNLYIRDRQTLSTTLVTLTTSGLPSSQGVRFGSLAMTDDGRFLSFASPAPDLVPNDTNGKIDAFVFDSTTGVISLLSVGAPNNAPANGDSTVTAISGDGRFVLFQTTATNLPMLYVNLNQSMICGLDRQTGLMSRVDVTPAGVGFNANTTNPAISADGSTVVVASAASNIPGIGSAPYYSEPLVLTGINISGPTSLPREGGTATYTVTATPLTRWTVSQQDAWITITDVATTGAGNGTVTISVPANVGTGRTGNFLVGKRPVSVYQYGDTTPPAITPSIVGTLVNGWYNTDISLTWSVVEPEGNIIFSNGCGPTLITWDTGPWTYTCGARNSAQLLTTQSVTVKRDVTPPTITITSPQATLYPTGTPLSVVASCVDSLSGLSACQGTPALGANLDTTTPGFHNVTVSATDNAGNAVTRMVEYAIGTGVCTANLPNLGVWWQFEGNTVDTYRGSNAPRHGGGTWTSDTYVPGIAGQAYKFPTQTFGGLLSDFGWSLPDGREFTVAAWVNPTNATDGVLVGRANQFVVARVGGKLTFELTATPYYTHNTGVSIPAGVWTHIAVVFGTNTVSTYVNGRLVETVTNVPAMSYPTLTKVELGSVSTQARYYAGSLDEVMIYLQSITADQIQAIYLAGSGGVCVPKTAVLDVPSPLNAIYGDATFAIPFVLHDTDGQPLAGRVVNLSVTGGVYPAPQTTITTDANGAGAWDAPLGTTPVGTLANAVVVQFPGDADYKVATVKRDLVTGQLTPVLSWNVPAAIVYGTPLSATQLNASADAPGTFAYAPAAGSILNVGTQALTATFTASSQRYKSGGSVSTTVTITKATPSLIFSSCNAIYDGNPHAACPKIAGYTGVYTTNPSVTVTYNGSSTVPVAAGTYTVVASYPGSDNYTPTTVTGTFTIARAPAHIQLGSGNSPSYDGQPHGTGAQATDANNHILTPVTITYNGNTAQPVNAGTYTVVATLDDPNYDAPPATGTFTIKQIYPSLSISGGGSYTYNGQPHAVTAHATGLNNEALSEPFTITYNGSPDPPVNAVGLVNVVATYPGSTNYFSWSITTTISIAKAMPTILWATPADIVYGTTLSATQLNAVVFSIPGTFSYSPGLGYTPSAGAQTLSVTFTPTDAVNYETTSKSVTLNVVKATPVVTWPAPAPIPYGTPLGAQLNATASVSGSFSYTPAPATVLNVGTGQTLSVTFTPSDQGNYNSVTTTTTIDVVKAHPTVTWSNPNAIIYGTALSASQLNATASVPGTLAYAPAAGAVLGGGTQTLQVTFTPQNTAGYEIETRTVMLTVIPAQLQVQAATLHKPFGAPMPVFTPTFLPGFVNGETPAVLQGTAVFTTSATAGSPVGVYNVNVSGLSSSNYQIINGQSLFYIDPAATTVAVTSSANPSGTNQAMTFTATLAVVAPGAGSPTGSIEFRDGSTRLGTVPLSGATASLSTNGLSVGAHTINAVYLGDGSFAGSTGSLTQTVNGASTSSTVAVTSSANPKKVGSSVTLTATITAPAGGVSGTVQFYDGATLLGSGTVASNKATLTTSSLATGGHAITARYLGNATVPPSISPVFVQTMTPTNSTPRTPTVALSASPSPATLDGSVTFTATVTGSLLTQPTGRVVFYVDGVVIGDPAGVALTGTGSTTAQATFATSTLAHGTHAITAAYTADSTYRGVATSITLVVN